MKWVKSHLVCGYLFCYLYNGSYICGVHKNWPILWPIIPLICRNKQHVYCLKTIESTNKWQISRPHSCVDVIKVWSLSNWKTIQLKNVIQNELVNFPNLILIVDLSPNYHNLLLSCIICFWFCFECFIWFRLKLS